MSDTVKNVLLGLKPGEAVEVTIRELTDAFPEESSYSAAIRAFADPDSMKGSTVEQIKDFCAKNKLKVSGLEDYWSDRAKFWR